MEKYREKITTSLENDKLTTIRLVVWHICMAKHWNLYIFYKTYMPFKIPWDESIFIVCLCTMYECVSHCKWYMRWNVHWNTVVKWTISLNKFIALQEIVGWSTWLARNCSKFVSENSIKYISHFRHKTIEKWSLLKPEHLIELKWNVRLIETCSLISMQMSWFAESLVICRS